MIRKLLLGLVVLIVLAVMLVVAAVVFIDPDDYREQISQRASETLGREVRLDGPMSLSFFPWLALEIEDVVVGNPPVLADSPPLARIGSAVASVRVLPLLSGQLETGAMTLKNAQVTLIQAPNNVSNLDGLLSDAAADPNAPATDLTGLSLGSITLEDVDLVQLDLVNDTQTTVAIERMTLDSFVPGQASAFSLLARVSDDRGDLLLIDELDGDMQVANDLSEIQITGVTTEYRLPGSAISGQASGEFRIQNAANLILTASNFEAVLDTGSNTLGMALGEPLSVAMGEAIDVNLANARLSIDEQPLSASGRLRLGETVRADMTLSGDTLDMRPLLSSTTSSTRSSTSEAEPSDAETASTDFSALEPLNLSFNLTLNQLILSDALSLSEVETRAQLRDGRLQLTPVQAQLFGGAFNGRVDVDFMRSPPEVSLQPELIGIAIDQLAELSGADAPLSGLADLQLALDFNGLDLRSILASLNGSGSFEIAGGAIEGVDLRRLIDEELTVNNLSNVSRAFGGRTEFDSLEGQVTITNGVIELPDMNLAAGDYAARGQGRIDFAADEVDYRLQLNLGPALTQLLPGTLRDATNGRIPLAIAGSVTQPTVTLDFNSLLEGALRQQLQDRLFNRDDDEPDQTGDQAQDQTQDNQEAEDSQKDSSDPQPETRERRSQSLLRGLLERANEDDEDASATEDDAATEPPP